MVEDPFYKAEELADEFESASWEALRAVERTPPDGTER
jgi:hypothetical protein